jgi:hypothetical protein
MRSEQVTPGIYVCIDKAGKETPGATQYQVTEEGETLYRGSEGEKWRPYSITTDNVRRWLGSKQLAKREDGEKVKVAEGPAPGDVYRDVKGGEKGWRVETDGVMLVWRTTPTSEWQACRYNVEHLKKWLAEGKVKLEEEGETALVLEANTF